MASSPVLRFLIKHRVGFFAMFLFLCMMSVTVIMQKGDTVIATTSTATNVNDGLLSKVVDLERMKAALSSEVQNLRKEIDEERQYSAKLKDGFKKQQEDFKEQHETKQSCPPQLSCPEQQQCPNAPQLVLPVVRAENHVSRFDESRKAFENSPRVRIYRGLFPFFKKRKKRVRLLFTLSRTFTGTASGIVLMSSSIVCLPPSWTPL
jgi:Skp family chaperone for outer membrane proteins